MTQKTCKPCCDWSEPISQKLARFSESELAFWKACTYDHSLWGKRARFRKLASFFALWNTVNWLQKRAYQSSQSHVANVKASSLWKLARFLVKWSPDPICQNIVMKACKVRKLGLDLACFAFGGNQSSSINLTEAWEHSPKNQAVTTSTKYQFHHEYNTSSRVLCFDVLLISANELESFGLLVWLIWSVPHPGWIGGVLRLNYKKSRARRIV